MPEVGEEVRARDLGVPFEGLTGPRNGITDVPGVEVGFTTVADKGAFSRDAATADAQRVRTGVTAIHPRGRQGVGVPVAAGLHSFNGNGELTGSHWINEAGSFTTPVLLTSTHTVGVAHRASIDWLLEQRPALGERWILPVVAETWDGRLNDANGSHLRAEHVFDALNAASANTLAEGPVGGGTGMVCYGRKGGNGTSSRLVQHGLNTYTVGVFVQANFGDAHELRIAGHALQPPPVDANDIDTAPPGAGSLIVVVATDAPLLPGQCAALARRATLGVGRTGTAGSHFSGDIFLAFSTANPGTFGSAPPVRGSAAETWPMESAQFVPWGFIDPFYSAVAQATEEAILNVLVAGRDVFGPDGLLCARLDVTEVRAIFEDAR